MRRSALLLAAIVALLSLAPRPALGCSCMEMTDPGQVLDEAGGAFVGTLVHKEAGGGLDGFSATYHFDVSQWVKSDLGDTVAVVSGMDSASCGWEQPTGEEIGVLLYFDGEFLTSGLCSVMDPGVLAELGESHVAAPTAAPPILPAGVGLDPASAETGSATTVARVGIATLAVAVVFGAAAALRRRRSVEEE